MSDENGAGVEPDRSSLSLAHDLRQPLNIMQLACANLRVRIGPRLDDADAVYFEGKLDRIEQQIARLEAMIDSGLDRPGRSPALPAPF